MLVWASSLFAQPHAIDSTNPFAPPATKKTPVTDTYFGVQVIDNYRWLEDMSNKEVQDWFKAQHDYTR